MRGVTFRPLERGQFPAVDDTALSTIMCRLSRFRTLLAVRFSRFDCAEAPRSLDLVRAACLQGCSEPTRVEADRREGTSARGARRLSPETKTTQQKGS